MAAKAILELRVSTPRNFKNTLVFLAADKARLQDLEEAVRRFLAWETILAEQETRDLSPHQVKQAENQRASADGAVTARLPETYQWLLVPVQPRPQDAVAWESLRLTGQDALAVRASRKLRNDELLVKTLAGTRLRMELDRVPLWRGDDVAIKMLAEDFAKYLYLPRLVDSGVLFGTASGAAEQIEVGGGAGAPGGTVPGVVAGGAVAGPLPGPKRFHGNTILDSTRVGRDAGRIADEVIAHLAGLVGSKVRVTLEIEAEIPSGTPDHVVRTVTENSRTLKFTS